MKNVNVKVLAALALSGATLAGCGGLGKMSKYAETIEYNVDPNPLIVRGDSVAVNINGTFPGKYFSKKASADITPTITYEAGSTPLKTVTFQGESAAGNGTVIPYESGKSFSYSDKVAYQPAMQNSELFINVLGRQGNKEKAFEPYKIADGVITTPFLVMSDDKVITATDNFQRVTSHEQYAVINYLVNSSYVRPGELSDDDIKSLDTFLKENGGNADYEMKNAKIISYASPEGEISLNENLAVERAESAEAAVTNIMKRRKVANNDGFFELMPQGEDWAGFKEKMQQSEIADKELILRILEMYSDVTKREEEIKNLAATYEEIADEILPELRRSQISVNYDLVGRSDDEIIAMARSNNADSLTVEELLYASTLTDDLNEQMAIYEKTAEVYPDDYRAYNNMGVVHMMRNEQGDAEEMFNQSWEQEANPVAANNRAIILRLKGNRAEAYEMLSTATEAGDDVNYNMGVINILNGDYDDAVQNMKGSNSFNKALAQLLAGNTEAAASTLEKSAEKDTAMGLYLKAIIGARMNNADMVKNSLQAAYAKDASLKEKAQNDLEFRNFQDQI